jgi:predicted NAD/FAD-binding protein
MRSWSEHSRAVFDAMLAWLGERVHLGTAITGIRADRDGVTLEDERGDRHRFDQVVLAGDARRLGAALDAGAHGEVKRMLERIRYVEQSDSTFLEGHAHGDASVLPAAHRDEILSEYCTFVDITERPGGRRYENHFVVSSWAPVARDTGAVMLVYYDKPAGRELAGPTRTFSNRGAHPDLSLENLFLARRLRRHQGRNRLHFCGSYTTPGNGHDLSLLSGLVVANALGAPYPFADDDGAHEDFRLLRGLMIGRS